MEVATREREQDMISTAFDLTPWIAFAELATSEEGADEDPYLADEEAETPDSEDMLNRDTNIAGIYFKEVSKVPLLTREREVELAKRIQMGERKIHMLLRECSAQQEELNALGRELENGGNKPRKLLRSREEVLSELMRKLEELSNHSGDDGERFRELLAELKKKGGRRGGGKGGDDSVKPETGRLYCQKVYQQGPILPGSHSGGKSGINESCGKVRLPEGI